MEEDAHHDDGAGQKTFKVERGLAKYVNDGVTIEMG